MWSGSRRLSACRICDLFKCFCVLKKQVRGPLGGGLVCLCPLPFSLNFDRVGSSRARSLCDHLPVGFRVTERASLAGNVSFSSSSSRWSAQCQSTLSGVGLVADALFRAAVSLEDCVWLAEVLICKPMLVQLGGFDGNLPPSRSFQLNSSLAFGVVTKRCDVPRQQPGGGDTPGVAAAPVALAGVIVPGLARYIVLLSAHADVFGVGTVIVGSMLVPPISAISG